MEKLKITVDRASLERLDTYTALQSSLTRAQIHRLITNEAVLVNGETKKSSYKVRSGDIIEVLIPEPEQPRITAQPLELDIIWEDEDIVVVNKPVSMVVYPAAGHTDNTLVNALLYRYTTLAGNPLRPGIVHRLDKDTSGAMVIARSDKAYRSLTERFRQREVEKHYRALAFGSIPLEMKEIRAPIGRSRNDRKKMSTRTCRAREAITELQVLEKYKIADFLDVKLITGRTHQIRVHLASQGHPVLGDQIYGRKTSLLIQGKKITIPRQMLHSYSLGFIHPVTDTFIEFRAPLPEDMNRLLKILKPE
jgi:23S rRNA pseudouridine1911/1915/1917 synthase